MNREIKFRTWDCGRNVMLNWDKLLLDAFDLGHILKNYQHDLCPYVLSQFTGLKDKNGVEIYEGDLLVPEWATDGSITPDPVKYIGHEFVIDAPGCLIDLDCPDAWQVIGNIYENPELLSAAPQDQAATGT